MVVVTLLAAAAGSVRAQHATASDVEDGRRVYQSSCANCHGPDGNLIAGIDFGRGQFRRNYTDAELGEIIRKGIPGTPMPATNVTEVQAARIVAYLRSLTASLAGGAATAGRVSCRRP